MKRKESGGYLFWVMYVAGLVSIVFITIIAKTNINDGLFNYLVDANRHYLMEWRQSHLQSAVLVSLIYTCFMFAWWFGRKKFHRKGEEYGSSDWAEANDINNRYSDKKEYNHNLLLTQNVSLSLNMRHHNRNLHTLVVGGSGSGKTRYYVKPNLLQANSSFFILDPKGELMESYYQFLVEQGYVVKVFNLIDMETSDCYNPFVYIQKDEDVQRLVTMIFKATAVKSANTNDPFFDTAAEMLLRAIIYYLWLEAPADEQNFSMVMEMLRASDVKESDDYKSPLDELFQRLEMRDPTHIAVICYRNYRGGSGKTLKSINITLAARLSKFDIPRLSAMTITDDMELDKLGKRKTAIFAVIPDNDSSFNFLISIFYLQMFQKLEYVGDRSPNRMLPMPVQIMMDEFANVSVPDDFDNVLAVIRSRGVSCSIILQNISQLKAMFEKRWESIVGNCDSLLYLGGNEPETHKMISELLGKETIDNNTFGKSYGGHGTFSTNVQNLGRELLTPSEVRKINNKYALLFIRGESAVFDKKYNLLKHPSVDKTPDGKKGRKIYKPYVHGVMSAPHSSFILTDESDTGNAIMPSKRFVDCVEFLELLSYEEIEELYNIN